MDVIDGLQALDLPVRVTAVLALISVALVAYDAVWGVRDHRAFMKAMAEASPDETEDVRARFLLRWAWQPWVLTLTTLMFVAATPDIGPGHLGLAWPDFSVLGTWFGDNSFARGTLIGAVAVLLAVPMLAGLAARRRREEGSASDAGAHETADKVQAAAVVNRSVEPMLPTGRRDRNAWLLLSVTAGVTEEVMYRGLLLLVLALLMPGAPEPVLWIAAAIGFALGHAYQRWVGMAATGALALVFIALYVGTGSLLPGMLLHVVMDARAALIKRAAGS